MASATFELCNFPKRSINIEAKHIVSPKMFMSFYMHISYYDCLAKIFTGDHLDGIIKTFYFLSVGEFDQNNTVYCQIDKHIEIDGTTHIWPFETIKFKEVKPENMHLFQCKEKKLRPKRIYRQEDEENIYFYIDVEIVY